jgi:tetratricopeptide (TPR) repeat protein
LAPLSFKAYNGRGITYAMKGQYRLALSDFKKALEINPEFAGAYSNRAVTYYSHEEYSKASEDTAKAEKLQKFDPLFLMDLRSVRKR